MRRGLAHIPKGRITVGKGDIPRVRDTALAPWPYSDSFFKAVHIFVEEELLRTCAIAQAVRPKVERRDGWGTPGASLVQRILLNKSPVLI